MIFCCCRVLSLVWGDDDIENWLVSFLVLWLTSVCFFMQGLCNAWFCEWGAESFPRGKCIFTSSGRWICDWRFGYLWWCIEMIGVPRLGFFFVKGQVFPGYRVSYLSQILAGSSASYVCAMFLLFILTDWRSEFAGNFKTYALYLPPLVLWVNGFDDILSTEPTNIGVHDSNFHNSRQFYQQMEFLGFIWQSWSFTNLQDVIKLRNNWDDQVHLEPNRYFFLRHNAYQFRYDPAAVSMHCGWCGCE